MISNGIFQRPRRDVFGVLGYGGAEILGKSDKECCEERVYEVCGGTDRTKHWRIGGWITNWMRSMTWRTF